MEIQLVKTTSQGASELRKLFLDEIDFQFIHDKCHLYNWADVYVFMDKDERIGYGSVWGKDNRKDRDTVFEFYLLPDYRKDASIIFLRLVEACGAPFMECQTNDTLLAGMMFEHATDIHAQSILFEDDHETKWKIPSAVFIRQEHKTDHPDDRGGYAIEIENEVAATGGFMLNYNHPFADIYMEVKEPFRGRGLGSLMVQELKKEIYKSGYVPAARCNVKNRVSRATLTKAGFRLCGYWLEGKIKKNN